MFSSNLICLNLCDSPASRLRTALCDSFPVYAPSILGYADVPSRGRHAMDRLVRALRPRGKCKKVETWKGKGHGFNRESG